MSVLFQMEVVHTYVSTQMEVIFVHATLATSLLVILELALVSQSCTLSIY